MNREKRIITAALQDREAYVTLAPVVEEADFTRHAWVVWQRIDNYYDEDAAAQHVDTELLLDAIRVDYPKHYEQFIIVLDGTGTEISTTNVVKEYLKLKEQGLRHRLAEACLADSDRSIILDLMDRLQTVSDVESDEDMSLDNSLGIDSLVEALSPENLIKIYPQELSDRIGGGLVRGSQIAIYANTEVGKTLLTINMACGLMRDGHRVLYLGNEDPKRMMLLRFYSNLSGMNREQIIAAPREAEERAFANGYGNLYFLDGTPGSIAEIRRAIERCDPTVFVTDQMANMEMGNSSKVEKNEELASALRRLAKKYDKVSIIVHQADDAAHGKLVLEKNNMHYSNVGVQGQMDVMIGMGMDAASEQQNRRMISLSKNKMTGDHSFFPITIDESLTRVVE